MLSSQFTRVLSRILPQVAVAFLSLTGLAGAQVDLTNWQTETYGITPVIPPVWSLTPTLISQTKDSDVVSFAYGGESLGDNITTVDLAAFHIPGFSEDLVGLCLGVDAGTANDPNANYLMLSWGGSTNTAADDAACTVGGTNPSGLRLYRVRGIPTTDEFWQGTDQNTTCSPLGVGLVELASAATLGNTPWAQNQTNQFEIRLSQCSLRVLVNGQLEFEVFDDFSTIVDGKLGMCCLSQRLFGANVCYMALAGPASINTLGVGTPGTDNIPVLSSTGCSVDGGNFSFLVTNSNASALSAGILRLSPHSSNLFLPAVGGTIWVGLTGGVNLPITSAAGGQFEAAFTLIPDPSIVGMDFFAQAFWLDAAAQGGAAITNGLELVIGL